MIAIVPARAGSKRIKNKNIRLLSGYPLIAYTIKACLLSEEIERVIVSTNCKSIADIAKSFGAEVPFLRPDSLALDNSSDFGFLDHFFKNIDCDEVALMRPTSPIRDPDVLDSVIKIYRDTDKTITGLRTVTFSNHSPYKMFQMDRNRICKGFFDDYKGEINYTNLPGQIFPKTYIPNGYIDIVKKETLSQGSVFGNKIKGVETPSITDIDIEDDFFLAELQVGTKMDKLNLNKGDKVD